MLRALVAVFALLVATQSTAHSDEGFQGIPWGSSPSSIMSRFGNPDENRRNEPEGFTRTLVYKDAELLVYSKFINLLFFFEEDMRKEGLVLVVYQLFDCPVARDLYDMLDSGLTSKYGEGQLLKKGKLWYADSNTSIELIYDNGLFLRYSDIAAARQRMQKLWEKL